MKRVAAMMMAMAATAIAPAAVPDTPSAPGQAVGAAARMQRLFASIGPRSPGCAVGVERGGKTLFKQGYGSANMVSGARITPDTVFYIASVSKQITAMNILLLAHDGKLDLHVPIGRYLPELPGFAAPLTIHQMLGHVSGLRDYGELALLTDLGDHEAFTEGDVIDGIRRQRRLNFPPGSHILYSNTGYVLSAIAAERATGRSFEALAQDQVFGPLGMTATRYRQDHRSAVAKLADGYVGSAAGWKRSDVLLDTVGDGGIFSSVDDMLKWLANFDSRAVGGDVLPAMQTAGVLGNGSVTDDGLGLHSGRYRGLAVFQHGGAYGGYRSADLWIPAEKLGIVALCNAAAIEPEDKMFDIADIFLADRKAASPPLPGPLRAHPAGPGKATIVAGAADRVALAGPYASDELPNPYRIIADGEGLRLSIAGHAGLAMIATGPDHYLVDRIKAEIVIARDDAGRPVGFELSTPRARHFTFSRLPS